MLMSHLGFFLLARRTICREQAFERKQMDFISHYIVSHASDNFPHAIRIYSGVQVCVVVKVLVGDPGTEGFQRV